VSEQRLFCEVILPLSIKGTYTYRIPAGWEELLTPGMRVEVQFGKRKHYTALVKRIHPHRPTAYQAKELLSVTDSFPVVTEDQLKFWDWLAAYYCCYLGEVMLAALPAYFRPDSETKYIRYPGYTGNILDLSDEEYMVASAFEHREFLTLEDIQLILQRKTVSKVLKSLLDKQVIYLQEFLEDRYKPRLEIYTRLAENFRENKDALAAFFKSLERSPKQTDLLLYYLSVVPGYGWIGRKELLNGADIGGTVHKALVDKGVFETEERAVYRVVEEEILDKDQVLNEDQQQALQGIQAAWEQQRVVLLRGVTASGKTHVYAELIRKTLAEGKRVLYLLPEIALTTQLIRRLEKMLGKVGVYHSRFNPAERVETWFKVLQQEYNIVVGARSAIFLPFRDLGLIIVDEEHDDSYKQNDPAPRYHARDSVIYLAGITGAKVLLGSATPSLESWANARAGKFGLVEMNRRHGDMVLPEIEFVDMTDARKQKQVTGVLSDRFQQGIARTLNAGRQVIVFQNRRGYAPYIHCRDCGWVPYCQHCDVSMTYHKFADQLKCHYCGYTMPMPAHCKVCESSLLELKGTGTERVEDDLQAIFPEARILRMDYDTAKSKYAHERIIEQFENHEADILIGTQMVTKGLDFEHVGLVGVLNADALLHYPDFRAMERAYQLLQQVSGRAGRSGDQGRVMIQIGNMKHPIIRYILDGDIERYYTIELNERMKFNYPPYVRMIHLSVRDKDERVVKDAAAFVYAQLHPRIIGECLGPAMPGISRLQGLYLREILIKLDRQAAHIQQAKQAIEEVRQLLYQYQAFRRVRLVIDVDP